MSPLLLALLLAQPANPYGTGTCPAGECVYQITRTSPVACRPCSGGGGGAGLPADPAACPASQWVRDQDASGVLTCSQPGWTDVSGKPSTFSPSAHTHVGGDVTSAVGTATALEANGTNCGAGQAAAGVDASGAAEGCFTPAGTYTLPVANDTTLGGVRGNGSATACDPSTQAMLGWNNTTGIISCSSVARSTGAAGSLQVSGGSSQLSSYSGANSCAAGQWFTGFSANGVSTCGGATLNNIGNPTGDKEFTFPSGNKMLWTFSGGTDYAFSIHGDGSFTGSGDLVHLHLQGTPGVAAGADVLHVEWEDTDATGLRLNGPSSSSPAMVATGAVNVTGTVTATQFSGPLAGNANTATALSTSGAANQFWKNGNVWGQPAFSDLSGSATTAQLPTIPVTKGGSNLTTVASNQVYVGTAADTFTAKTLPSCSNATTSKLLYDNATQTFSCGTDQTAAGSGTLIRLTGADYTNSTTTPSNILTTSLAANTEYGFTCEITGQGTATSLPRYNINGPTANNVTFRTARHTSTSAQTLLVLQTFSAAAQTAACTSACNATNLPTRISGTFTTTASGTFALMGTSSTAGQTVTVRRGSYCIIY